MSLIRVKLERSRFLFQYNIDLAEEMLKDFVLMKSGHSDTKLVLYRAL